MPAPQLSAPWQVKFTRRRGSIAIQIGTEQIKVLAPKGTPTRAIHALLEQRREWIEQSLLQQQQRPRFNRHYSDGENLLFHGNSYRLRLENTQDNSEPIIKLQGSDIVLQRPRSFTPQQHRECLQHWFQQQAQQSWPGRLEYWAKITGLQPKGLKIRAYKSRWGSCNSRGLISLNTLLMMTPPATQDYVIVHELCHLQHPNHSAAFWQLVERYSPAPKQHRTWLRQHLAELVF
ncbi:MAG: SprT family zinc-dependent metalloprotease [Halopseudomonas sp.]